MKRKPISQQVVVLFGATSGIGLITALRFADLGAQLVLTGRSEEGLAEALHWVKQFGARAIAVIADAQKPDDVRMVAEEAVSTFGRLDTWVHLAAVSEWALFEETPVEDFKQIIEVTLLGQVYGANSAMEIMRQQPDGGGLIHVTSVAGMVPLPYQSAYTAAKFGTRGFLDTLRLEIKQAGYPISVTNIVPSSINTPLFEKARTRLGVQPRPIPPVYEPELVADAIVFAAENPKNQLIVGGSGYLFQWIRRLAPGLLDAGLMLVGFRGQRSRQPESVLSHDNLYEHASGYNRIKGKYGDEAWSFSLYTWLMTHPIARYAVIGAVIGGVSMLFWSKARRR